MATGERAKLAVLVLVAWPFVACSSKGGSAHDAGAEPRDEAGASLDGGAGAPMEPSPDAPAEAPDDANDAVAETENAPDAGDDAEPAFVPQFEPGDTPPWRPLHVTATAMQHARGLNGVTMGMDGRAVPIGKLAVDLGIAGGGYSPWLGKRGYHVLGVTFDACTYADQWSMGRDVDDRCHADQWAWIAVHVRSLLALAAEQFPEEDWGYFLNPDGSVRWSDVAITGMGPGAGTAAYIGRLGARFWRVVGRSGPTDNTCGSWPSAASYDPAMPWLPVADTCDPTHCCLGHIAEWLDAPSMTPVSRLYAVAGMRDGHFGEIMFAMERGGYPGQPIIFDVPGVTLTGSNRFVSMSQGSLDWLNSASVIKPLNTDAVMNIAFAIPPENQNPTF
jgi:hypothetical protein